MDSQLTVQGVQAVFDIVIIRRGNQILGIALGDIGSVDTTQLEQFVGTALGKIT